MISLICCLDANGSIGIDNQLPWHIPEDLAWFKKNTLNKPVVMGRKTYESIGKPLPNRINVVLTRDRSYKADKGVLVFHSISDAIHELHNEREIMICGGEEVYKQFLPYANRIYLTRIKHTFEGTDACFPSFDTDLWNEYFYQKGSDESEYEYSFHVYKKRLE